MSRQLTIFVGAAAAIGAGFLGISSASAALANGPALGAAGISAGQLSEKVVWRGRAVGWRGVGWRPGWRGGVGWRAGWGWRPGLTAAGLAAAGVATGAAYNYGYGDYQYGPYYGPAPYIVTPWYYGGYRVTPNYGYAASSYGYLPYP